LNIGINPSAGVERVAIDPDHDCLVFDDFLLEPESLVDYACARREAFFMQERGYPGEILPLTESEARPLHAFVRSTLSRAFGFLRGGLQFQTQLSLTTLQPSDMSWIQCLPHSDPRREAGRANYATVLYLFEDESLGGTGFYRWKDKAFWQDMTARQLDEPEAGLDELRSRFRMFREPWSYTTVSNEAVDLLARVPARFNRLIAYSGDLPHSAWIEQPERLDPDPRHGRLSLNCFASAWRPQG